MQEYHSHCSKLEEKLNTLTHAPGIIVGAIIFLLLFFKFLQDGIIEHLLSYITYSITFILLFTASTVYHFTSNGTSKLIMRRVDHSCIYLFMAGCYTPFIVINMSVDWKYYFLSFVWFFAILGVIQKFKFKFNNALLTVAPYLAFSYMCLMAKKDLLDVLPRNSFNFLLAGGICYTVGVIFYVAKKLKFNHSIWHILVLAGAILHFLAIYTAY